MSECTKRIDHKEHKVHKVGVGFKPALFAQNETQKEFILNNHKEAHN